MADASDTTPRAGQVAARAMSLIPYALIAAGVATVVYVAMLAGAATCRAEHGPSGVVRYSKGLKA